MKIVNYILSIIIIIISSMPCADVEVNSAVHSTMEMASNQDNHSHSKENDSCPPFCICNCCGAQILSYNPEINLDFPEVTTIISTISLPAYKSIPASNFYGSIWQPPQIA